MPVVRMKLVGEITENGGWSIEPQLMDLECTNVINRNFSEFWVHGATR